MAQSRGEPGDNRPLYPVSDDDEPDDDTPLPDFGSDLVDISDNDAKRRIKLAATSAINALNQWQQGNLNFAAGRFREAVANFSRVVNEAKSYFNGYHQVNIDSTNDSIASPTVLDDQLVWLREPIGNRRLAVTLEELASLDWLTPTGQAIAVIKNDLEGKQVAPAVDGEPQARKLLRRRLEYAREWHWDRMLFLLIAVHGPLARAETYRMLGQPARAVADCERVLAQTVLVFRTLLTLSGSVRLPRRRVVSPLCIAIEIPFVRLLYAELLVDRGNAEYQSGHREDAHATYQLAIDALDSMGNYVAYAAAGVETLRNRIVATLPPVPTAVPRTPLLAKNAFRIEPMLALGHDINIPVFSSSDGKLPLVNRSTNAHRSLLVTVKGERIAPTVTETNPRAYVVLLTAHFRQVQIIAKLNFLGYNDDYVPPWRFGYALDRARYFAQQAKSAHRDYLNFLATAEREEFQELTASQQIELEKSNVRLESARVDQALQAIEAATASADLALVAAQNSAHRIDNYRKFDATMHDLEDKAKWASWVQSAAMVVGGIALIAASGGTATPIVLSGVTVAHLVQGSSPGGMAQGAANIASGIAGAYQADNAQSQSEARRELELSNLQLAQLEAVAGFDVALQNLRVARAGFTVAALQREVSLLRHEFAVQNVQFLASRNLNAEQWHRMAVVMQGIAVTYMRYAVELAFLAEQAYEFEADRQINVIRFDYTRADTGEFLAADMLLLDLDTLEQDLLVTRKSREQQVRYVLSMSREFPEALQELRRHGKATFGFVLEQMERRLPGLFNARLVSVDVLPLALMDPSRFSCELTHLGYGQVRQPLRQGEEAPEPTANLSDAQKRLEAAWPRRQRIFGPETAIFSGLSKQDESAHFAYAAQGQRGAFESRPAAGAWQIDFTAKDNQIVPDGLADVLITFNIAGFHDSGLRELVEQAAPKQTTPTRQFSARASFPDAYYGFDKTGRLSMELTDAHLALTGKVGRMRNLGLLLVPRQTRTDFDHMFSRFSVDFRVLTTGAVSVLSPMLVPNIVPLASNRIRASIGSPAGATVSWRPGATREWVNGNAIDLDMQRSGSHELSVRVAHDGKLHERTIQCYASADGNAARAFVVAPGVSGVPGTTTGMTKVRLQSAAAETAWHIHRHGSKAGKSAEFELPPGDYTVTAVTNRPLKLRLYSSELYKNGIALGAGGLSLRTNRQFKSDGTNLTTEPNELTKHLFGANGKNELGAIARWMVDVLAEDNPELHRLPSGSLDLSALQDVVLVTEYDVAT